MDDSITSQNSQLKQNQSQQNQLQQNLRSEKRILRISFAGSAAFLLSECIAAILTHSQAVLMDCVYDLVDLAMLGPFMILVPKLYKPVTEKWPYGMAQIESLFIIIKCGLLLFLDMQLLVDSAQLILRGGHDVNAGFVAAFEIGISVSCILMYFILRHLNKKFSSPTVNAELYIWKLDAYSTGGVGLAFLAQLVIQRTPLAWLAPYIDPAIAIFMAVILAKEPIMMIWDALKSLVLVAPKEEIMENIRSLVNETFENFDFHIDFLDVVKTGRKVWVDVYITQASDMISIKSLKAAHDDIVDKLKAEYKDIDEIYVELIPEVNPVNRKPRSVHA